MMHDAADCTRQVAFEVGDMKAFFGRRTAGASLHGADRMEMATVLMGKAVHWGLLCLPLAWGASLPTIAAGAMAYICSQVTHPTPTSFLPLF